VKKVFLSRVVLDEPEPFINSQRTNCSCHGISWVQTHVTGALPPRQFKHG
jgi:hypothetical protein